MILVEIVITIQHPAHVHFFRHAIDEFREHGHDVHVFAREKDIAVDLLTAYDIEHEVLAGPTEGLAKKIAVQVRYELALLRRARAISPDVMLAIGEPGVVHVATLLGCRSILFSDSEHVGARRLLVYPFADLICTPDHYDGDLGDNHVRYPGYHELAYLHPNRFTPDPSIRDALDIDDLTPLVVLRLVSWTASHDVGNGGIENPEALVERLEAAGARVLITAESSLPPSLRDYRIPLPNEAVHDLLYDADLYIGDSATMATESAVLGTPAIFVSTIDTIGNMHELEEYGLVYGFSDEQRQADALETAVSIIEADDDGRWAARRSQLLDEKIDTTGFVLSVVYGEGLPADGTARNGSGRERPLAMTDSDVQARSRANAGIEFEQGAPDPDALLSLLNSAFEGWGNEAYFRWKYDRYPGYDERAHNFYATADGRLVGCRRIFSAALTVPATSETVEFFVHGGTAVAEGYRGRGLFSQLMADSHAYSEREGAPLVMTFNRKGKTSTKAHRKHGWEYRTLPIYLRILSPSTIIGEHAQTLLSDHPLLERLAATVDDRVAVSDGRLNLGGKSRTASGPVIRISDRAVGDVVEIVGDVHDASSTAAVIGRLLRNGEITIGWTGEAEDRSDGDSSADELPGVTVADELPDDDLPAVRSLFADEIDGYDLAFRRSEADIVHQTQFPSADVITVDDADRVTGYAALGAVPKGDTNELRVLDAVYDSAAVFERLAEAVERRAIERDVDVVVWATRVSPGELWTGIDTEYAMWEWFDRDERLADRLQHGDWRVAMYDIV